MWSKAILITILISSIQAVTDGEDDDNNWNWDDMTSANRFFDSSDSKKRQGDSNHDNAQIIGGTEAPPDKYKYEVALIMKKENSETAICAGSLISTNYVLTAAHCLEGVKSVQVILGSSKIKNTEPSAVKLNSKEFQIHENYNDTSLQNDIALIKLPKSVQLNDNIQTIDLATKGCFKNVKADLAGWGQTSENSTGASTVLREITLNTISNKKCKQSFDDDDDDLKRYVKPTMLCTSSEEGKKSCKGDSGGPLVHDGKQIGIVSWGKSCSGTAPSVFTRTTCYLKWIRQNSDIGE